MRFTVAAALIGSASAAAQYGYYAPAVNSTSSAVEYPTTTPEGYATPSTSESYPTETTVTYKPTDTVVVPCQGPTTISTYGTVVTVTETYPTEVTVTACDCTAVETHYPTVTPVAPVAPSGGYSAPPAPEAPVYPTSNGTVPAAPVSPTGTAPAGTPATPEFTGAAAKVGAGALAIAAGLAAFL